MLVMRPLTTRVRSVCMSQRASHVRTSAWVYRESRGDAAVRFAASGGRWKGQYDRVLLASLGLVGGGVATTALYKRRELEKAVETVCYRGEEDDTWSGHLQSSARTLKRQADAELQDDNRKVLVGIIAANTLVCGLWRLSFRYPTMQRLMWRHFACSYNAVVHGKRFHTLFTSAFSHITIPHIAINMFMLWEFGHHILAPKDNKDAWLDKALARSRTVEYFRSSYVNTINSQLLPLDKFLTLYVSSALSSSALSILMSRVRGNPGTFTLGASGAVMGVLTMYCLLFPDRQLMLYGFIDMTAAQMLQAMTAFNLIGSAFQRGLQIDCTGHLGGQATGLAMHQIERLE
ncbi:hypothetical protein Poli38472_000956 [Pythium oligandrum]|uniref:Peptidase S54 rhomboid domain-containing protein n=1 Tax=Pythium oligandrum TaxID=41045 RepID=A0A8K1FHE0_PYTOL|nr:hypothetical protein Poli38472_000956 [Pythium oligandrum]|eukprot:TMW60914.1 hypothetical protein Poli38472_000956 [Pythium oligandrum]